MPKVANLHKTGGNGEIQSHPNHYRTNTDSEDYWQRAFTFGSSKFKLDTENIKYIFDANTGKAIRLDGVQVKPLDVYEDVNGNDVFENFDFDSNQGIAKEINSILKQIIDPSGIGRTVDIVFTDNRFFKFNGGTFTQEDYRNAIYKDLTISSQSEINMTGNLPNIPIGKSPNMRAFLSGLKHLNQSNIYDFLNEKEQIVIFGSENRDMIKDYQAKNLKLDNEINTSSLGKFRSFFADLLADIDGMNKYKDYLKNGVVYISGKENDTLDGGAGNDTLIGGTGFDTYILEGFDTIYDSDGQGQLQYANGTTIPFLEQKTSELWTKTQGTVNYIAVKNDSKLIITQQNTESGETTQTIIKDFFTVAITDSTSIRALNVELQNTQSTDQIPQNGTQPTINPNYGATIYAGGIQDAVNLTGSNKADFIFSGDHAITADLKLGDDTIYGSSVADNIIGNAGNDILIGSAPALENKPHNERPTADNDTLIGSQGNDLIDGGLGNDILFGEEKDSYLSQDSLTITGDWILGGLGNDAIYGGQAQDFLQGGQGSDFINAGAGNDVILGDGNLWAKLTKQLQQPEYVRKYMPYLFNCDDPFDPKTVGFS